MSFLTGLLGKKRSPLEDIAFMLDKKNAGGIIKYLGHEDKSVRKAAIDALQQMLSTLTADDISSLVAFQGNIPKQQAKEFNRLFSSLQAEAYQRITPGMGRQEVIRLMGQPDREMKGVAYCQAYGALDMLQRHDTWMFDPHWVYKMKGNSRHHYLVVFVNGSVDRKSEHHPERITLQFFVLVNNSDVPVTVAGQRQSIDDTGGYGVREVMENMQPGESVKVSCEFRIHGTTVRETTVLNVFPLGKQPSNDPLMYEVFAGEKWEVVFEDSRLILKEYKKNRK